MLAPIGKEVVLVVEGVGSIGRDKVETVAIRRAFQLGGNASGQSEPPGGGLILHPAQGGTVGSFRYAFGLCDEAIGEHFGKDGQIGAAGAVKQAFQGGEIAFAVLPADIRLNQCD